MDIPTCIAVCLDETQKKNRSFTDGTIAFSL